MSVDLIRKALEKKLAALAGGLPTSYQNFPFDPPEDGGPYQRCAVLHADPVSPTMGRKLIHHTGVFQVTLMYPEGQGTAAVEAQAKKIVAHFVAPQTLAEGGIKVNIIDAVKVVSGFPSDGRFAVPVSIPWSAYISG